MGVKSKIKIKHFESLEEEEKELPLSKLILSAVLFAAALIVQKTGLLNEASALTRKFNLSQTAVNGGILAVYFISYIMCGLQVLKEAVEALFKGKPFDEKFLMSLASVAAIIIGEIPEAVAIMLFYQAGEFFEDKAVDKSKASIKALAEIRPDHATVIRNGKEQKVKAEEVELEEIITVKPGERIPLDGIIVKGNSFADTSALTGESFPKELSEGQEVFAGYVNSNGLLEIKVTRNYSESAASRILDLVENAQEKKSMSEQFITRFSKIYTPAVCLLALMISVIPPLFIKGFPFTQWIHKGLMFLVVSCPCALVISIPLSFFTGIGTASRKGILFKGSSFIEKLSRTDTFVFDKTGTITKGMFAVTDIHSADEEKYPSEKLLEIAAHAEFYSTHPISRSLKQAHHCEKCGNLLNENTEEIKGQGIKTILDGQQILAGNEILMKNNGVKGMQECLKDDRGTIVHVAVDGNYAGHIVINDALKEDSQNALINLKKSGIRKTVMLTGDSKSAAENVQSMLEIDECYSQLLPEDKIEKLEELIAEKKDSKKMLAFAGDGINDAPAITRSDVGFAMGAMGSDAAIEAADVVIMDDSLLKINEALCISKRTMRTVRENIILALGMKFAIMVLSALGITGMWLAVFGDVGISIICIINAMIKKTK